MDKSKEDDIKGYRTLVYIAKTLFVMTAFLTGFLYFLFAIGYPQESVSLRNFPYPYRAGLALCSDIDQTDSVEEFLAIQKFLCTDQFTPWGEGLNLEIGNSFWFYDFSGLSNFTIFDTAGNHNYLAAEVIEDFIRAGYIDVLHTYGDFTTIDFKTVPAQRAAEYFREKGLSISTWVNHGGRDNTQCIGRMKYQLGDNPGSDEYHTYLFDSLGVKYVETFMVTHLISMENFASIKDWLKKVYEFLLSIKVSIAEGSFNIDWNNRLVNVFTLDDNRQVLRFRRFINRDGWIPRTGVDAMYLTHQIGGENLDQLIEAEGYMIVYTQLGANTPYSEWLPKKTRRVLRGLAERSHEGKLFITTTTRLLDYYCARRFLDWKWRQTDEGYKIEINSIMIPTNPDHQTSIEDLMGLTFYTPNPEKTEIFFQGELIDDVQLNPIDYTGRPSISIIWRWLQFPQEYR